MADYYEAGHAEPTKTRNFASMANWAGAGVSLLLVAGIGVWGYQLLVRDVSGVPVVRATQGPMRIAPETPGGLPADHQGLAVNSVAGHGVAEAAADRVVLAPKPVSLQAEDRPSGQIVMPNRLKSRTAADDVSLTSFEATAAATATGGKDAVQALADQIAGNAKPLSGAKVTDEPAETTKVASAAGISPKELAALVGTPEKAKVITGPARSLRPVLRPSDLSVRKVAAPAASAPVSIDVDPSSIAAGTRLVQFGAYASPEIAKSEWDRLGKKFADFLEGKQRVIQRAESGGKTFYRLRALGFEDVSDARQFCAAIVAGKAECIPVVAR